MKAKGWCLMGLLSFFHFLTGCNSSSRNENPTKFDWYATESGPKLYPMEIIQGTFFYQGQNEGLYIPYGGTLSSGWGTRVSHHVVGADEKPLPDRVKVVFYSYTEKQFYKGEFTLPYEKILAAFREHNLDPENPYFSSIQIGIAPGGVVAVWLDGYETREIFFGQAEKVTISPSNGFRLPFKSVEQSDAYVQEQVEYILTPDQLAALKKMASPLVPGRVIETCTNGRLLIRTG